MGLQTDQLVQFESANPIFKGFAGYNWDKFYCMKLKSSYRVIRRRKNRDCDVGRKTLISFRLSSEKEGRNWSSFIT
jgi:hypothetical protein